MKKRDKSIDSYIGFFATRGNVTGILMRKTDTNLEVLSRFVKHRIKVDELGGGGDRFNTAGSGLKSGDDSDFTLQMAGPGGQVFSPVETGQDEPGITSLSQEPTAPFLVQTREILTDARSMGISSAELSFCTAAPDVNHVEVKLPVEDVDTDKTMVVSGSTRKKLLKALPEVYTESFESERVGFIPMQSDGNMARFLAVVPVVREPVVPTLRMMALQMKSHMPRVHGIRTDISVLATLVGRSAVAQKGQRTAVVRVGTEDTMILLFDGPKLQYSERLRSITTYDSPEKVCSRIMLQQDESKIGELDNVLILSDGRLTQLIESFQSFYPDAVVEPMLSVLEEHGVRVANDEGGVRAGAILAIGAAAIDALAWEEEKDPAAAINLLPKKLLPKETGTFAFSWHTALMLAVLFGVTFMSVTSYLDNKRQIEQKREEIMSIVPAGLVGDPATLQKKVDSLNQVHARLTQSLRTLDSLLVGSDRWSRFLDHLSHATGEESGIWLFKISSGGGGKVSISGSARTRSRVSDFAREMGGSIEQLASTDVHTKGGEVTVYNFQMETTVKSEMPEVALYLREHAMTDEDFSDLAAQQQNMPPGFVATPMTDAAKRKASKASGGE